MGRHRRLGFVITMAVILCLVFSLAVPVFAQEGDAAVPSATFAIQPASPDGVYAVVGTTNTGKQVTTNVSVTSSGEHIQFQADVMGVPLTTSGPASWNADRTEVTVPVSIYVFGLAEASGSITLIANDTGWDFFGTGDGKVLSKKGSATAEGFMPGGVESSPELIAEATGVSETAQSIDDATGPLQPGDTQAALDTGEELAVLATLLFLVFLEVILEMILGIFPAQA